MLWRAPGAGTPSFEAEIARLGPGSIVDDVALADKQGRHSATFIANGKVSPALPCGPSHANLAREAQGGLA